MKIYIAAGFDRQDEMRLLASRIEGWTKHLVVSRWHGRVGGDPPFPANSDRRTCAEADVEDIRSADILLSMGGSSTQGGRHTELGMAWILNLHIIHLGEKENVFHYLPGITHVPNLGALMDVLRENFHYKNEDKESA